MGRYSQPRKQTSSLSSWRRLSVTATSLSGYGYSVAGKTGTGEVSGKGDNSWFIGYAPAEQPQIAICVLVENDEGYYESALPVANAVLQAYLAQ